MSRDCGECDGEGWVEHYAEEEGLREWTHSTPCECRICGGTGEAEDE